MAIRKLKPEKSDSYTVGILYNASWAQDILWTGKLNLEVTYYHDLIKGAIQAQDLQALLNACINQGGGTDADLVRTVHSRGQRQPQSAEELPGQPRTHPDGWRGPEVQLGVQATALRPACRPT